MVIGETLVYVESIMRREVPVVDKDDNLSHAVNLMKRYEIDRVLVVEEGSLVGIMTKKDIMVRLGTVRTRAASLSRLHVSGVMTGNPITTSPKFLVDKVVRVMVEANIASLPVVGNSPSEILGIVTRFEVANLALKDDSRITSVARPVPEALPENTTLLHARQALIKNDVSLLPVLGGSGEIVGVVTVDDVADALTVLHDVVPSRYRRERLSSLKVSDVLTKSPVLVGKDDMVGDVVKLLLRERSKGAVIVDDDRPIGLVTLADIVRHLTSII